MTVLVTEMNGIDASIACVFCEASLLFLTVELKKK
jgi:hypothetical protein